ncbi:MAG: response regulator [Deltaproteobacteria bacterium]|nr:MAG: response regulator [Deltaproteobacteria bacterium]
MLESAGAITDHGEVLFERLSTAWEAFQRQARASIRILVVDDEAVVCQILSELFGMEGYQVDSAYSIAEARRRLATGRYDLMIVDKNLPDGSGLELIRSREAGTPYVPSVVITAYPTAETVVEALTAGASDYLAKPFEEMEHVRARVQSLIDRRLARRLNDRMVQDLTQVLSQGGADRRTVAEIARQLFAFKRDLNARPAVLVVEDDLSVADVIRASLKEAKFRAEVATHLAPAKIWLTRHDGPLTALLSVELPEAMTVIRELKQTDPLLEVVVTSGSTDTDLALQAVAAGAADYVLRPFEGIEVLRARMQRAIARARRRRLYLHLIATLYRAAKAAGEEHAQAFLDGLAAQSGATLEGEVPAGVELPAEEIDLSDLFESEVELDITVEPELQIPPEVVIRPAGPEDEALPLIEAQPIGEDRRRAPRIPAALEVRFRTHDASDFAYAHLRDISTGGLFIQMDPAGIEAGTRLRVDLLLGWGQGPISLDAEVVRSVRSEQPGHSGIGVRFLDDATELEQVVRDLVRRTVPV